MIKELLEILLLGKTTFFDGEEIPFLQRLLWVIPSIVGYVFTSWVIFVPVFIGFFLYIYNRIRGHTKLAEKNTNKFSLDAPHDDWLIHNAPYSSDEVELIKVHEQSRKTV